MFSWKPRSIRATANAAPVRQAAVRVLVPIYQQPEPPAGPVETELPGVSHSLKA